MTYKYLLLFFILLSAPASAQMFSVGGESETQRRASSNYLRIGYTSVNFDFTGNSSIVPAQNRFDFNSSGISIGLESPAFNASVSFINRVTGSDDEKYLKLSLDYINRFAFVRQGAFQFGAPLNLKTSLVNVEKEDQSTDFSQSVFGVGLGFFTAISIPEKVTFLFEGIPSYGFSNSRGGLFGGSNRGLVAKARINFLNLLGSRSLSIGYDYNISSYDLDNDEFDYDLTSHLITLGVSL